METLTLEQKGAVRPPPVLAEPYERVSRAVAGWPGVVSATHWHFSRTGRVDGADFYVGEEELGHLHLDGEVHLAAGRALSDALIAAGLAERFAYGRDWAEASIDSDADADHAIALFRLNYDRIRGTPAPALQARIDDMRTRRRP